MPTKFVRNNTKVPQIIGNHEIPPESIRRLPELIAIDLQQHQPRNFTVLSDAPDEWVFRRTEHQPWNVRYSEAQRR